MSKFFYKAPITVTPSQAQELYRFAFGQICDPKDWKAPIDAHVPKELAHFYKQAIEFMTATQPRVVAVVGNDTVHLQSEGYRMGPAGDH